VRVGNVIAKLRPFAANVAYLCHGSTPEFFGISCRRGRSSRCVLTSGARTAGTRKSASPVGLPNSQYTVKPLPSQGDNPEW
jgi:hypothetical protein